MRPSRTSAGFTLVELLVVVSIIAVLLALLIPSMELAVEKAKEAKCAANLHAFHIGIGSYAVENQNQLLTTARYSTEHPYPHAPFVYATTRPGHWSLEAIRPYVYNSSHGKVGPLWYCPSAGWDWFYPNNDTYAAQSRTTKPSNYHQGWYVQIGYAYFARVEEWEAKASHPDQITGRGLGGSGQILMADTLYRWNGNGGIWVYNHGPYKSAGVPGITGTNNLRGDGGVFWVGSSQETNAAMEARSGAAIAPYVFAEGTPATTSLNYYLK